MCTSRRLRVTPEQDGCCHEQDNDQLLVFKIMMLVMHTGVSKSRYFGISIPIKYSNFSRFYKKMGPFYKKFRCDKFGN